MGKMGKGIYLRGKTYWLAVQISGKRKFISLQTGNPAEAITRSLQVRQHDDFQTREGFDRDLERFLTHKKDMDRYSARTLDWAGGVLRQFGKYVQNKSAAKVDREDVEKFYRELRSRMTENGSHSYMRAVKSFFSWCVANKIRFDNPSTAIKLGKPAQPARLRVATKVQRDAIIRLAPSRDMGFVFYCAFHAGMRFNEITEARPDWFNLKGRYIEIQKTETFRSKNRKSRTVPLSTPFLNFLQTYGKPSPFMLLPDVGHGRARYRYDFSRPWKLHMARMGLKWITPHTARRTFASLLVGNGESVYKVAKWLGDTLEVTERHYAHLAKDDRSIDRML